MGPTERDPSLIEPNATGDGVNAVISLARGKTERKKESAKKLSLAASCVTGETKWSG